MGRFRGRVRVRIPVRVRVPIIIVSPGKRRLLGFAMNDSLKVADGIEAMASANSTSVEQGWQSPFGDFRRFIFWWGKDCDSIQSYSQNSYVLSTCISYAN